VGDDHNCQLIIWGVCVRSLADRPDDRVVELGLRFRRLLRSDLA
jgi:hypothetical protein